MSILSVLNNSKMRSIKVEDLITAETWGLLPAVRLERTMQAYFLTTFF
jgi:hypothetical protein